MKQEHNYLISHMEEIDTEIKLFIENVLTSFIRLDIIKFFYDNHNTADTLENIARNIGREKEKVEKDLNALVEHGFLKNNKQGKYDIYSYPSDEEKKTLIKKFMEYSKTREGRLKIIFWMIREGDIKILQK